MAIDIRVDEGAGVVVMTIRPPLSREEVHSATTRLIEHPGFIPGMNLIAVVGEDSNSRFTTADLRAMADFTMARQDRIGSDYRLALVVSSSVDFGMSRAYQTWSNDLPREARVFYSLSEAQAWVSADMPVSGVRARRPLPSRPAATRER